MKKDKNPLFTPLDKPKSYVIGQRIGLVMLFVASPIMLIGQYINNNIIQGIGTLLFFVCFLGFFVSGVVWFSNHFNND